MAERAKKALNWLRKRKNERVFSVLLFLLKFNLLAIPMYALMYLNVSFPPLQHFLAEFLYTALKTFGYDISKNRLILGLTSGFTIATVKISVDCTGWKSMYALAALMIATPVPNDRNKLKFLVLGMASIFLINMVRLLTTITIVYRIGFQYLDVIHTILWREGLILAVIAIWYLWLRKVAKNKR